MIFTRARVELLLPPLVVLRWRAAFRQFVGRSISRLYRTSMLGFLWALIVPLFTLAIYTFVFGVVMQSRADAVGPGGRQIPYALYLFAGLIVFWLMAQTMGEACSAIVRHTNLVKKAVFPLEIIPATTVGAALFHTLINTLILVAALALSGGTVPATALLFPLVLLPFALMLAGFAWFLAALGVYFRDMDHIIGLVMTACLFLSPVFYSLDRLNPKLHLLVLLNPVSFIVVQARHVLLEGLMPDWQGLTWYLAAAWAIAILGLGFFRRTRRSFADVL